MKQQNIDLWSLAASKVNNELSDEEEKQLEQLQQLPDFEKIYAESKKLKKQLKNLREIREYSATSSWSSIQIHIRNPWRKIILNTSKYAAIVVIAMAIGSLINTTIFRNNSSSFTEISVPAAQMSEVKLPDGTRVQLNSNATFKYSSQFGITNRDVELHGEAFFDVKQNKQLPFQIKLKNSKIEVLGTSFNVASFDDELTSEITLIEGSLQINNLAGNQLAILKPGQQIVVNADSEKNTIREVNTEFYMSWRDGKIIFDNETLENIAKKMERWYHVDIEFESEDIKQLRLSATILKNKPLTLTYSVFERLLPVIKINYIYNSETKDKMVIQKQLPMRNK